MKLKFYSLKSIVNLNKIEMKNIIGILTIIIALLFSSCISNDEKADAYGNFEATEIIISSEANGKLLDFKVENGQKLKKDEIVGQVDTVMLIEKKRIENLIADSAATTKQFDDINGKIRVIDKQIESVRVKNNTILSKSEQLDAQIEEVKELISKCKIINPIDAIVLQKYAEPFELVMQGKALYKIADLSKLELKVYVDGTQLQKIKIGQKAKVYIDKTEDENIELEGIVSWISSTAEFTPKIIQTKEERVKLVYAVKLIVKNNGSLKIGMPGEVNFSN